jgi:hypothetical protein
MAVTVEDYTATATWTASGLADLFRDAFIDAGLMAAWYDTFLDTVENRVLEVQYGGSKTYGKTYYWFQFTTGGVFISVATGWNATTHVPTGTAFLDYLHTTTNSTSNHRILINLSATTTATLTRYTSGVNSDFSWFLLRNGTTNFNFHIPDAGAARVGWLDLDKVWFGLLVRCRGTVNQDSCVTTFINELPQTRRGYLASAAGRERAEPSYFNEFYRIENYAYVSPGNAQGTYGNTPGSQSVPYIILPNAFTNTNPAFTSNVTPVFTGLNYWAYLNEAMPSDFGIASYYLSTTLAVRDRLIVTAATEEWEMINITNNSAVTRASGMFVARVV